MNQLIAYLELQKKLNRLISEKLKELENRIIYLEKIVEKYGDLDY